MDQTIAPTYRGRWRKLVNWAVDEAGSIHDDEAARKVGFESGFVPGSTVGGAVMPAILDRYGSSWMEGGWYEFKFVTPVYEHNEVRETAEPIEGEDCIAVRLETREGRLCCAGRAGIGEKLPWDPKLDGKRGVEGALPDIEIGLTYDETEFVITGESIASLLEAAGEESPWYRTASPWGGPVAPPERLMTIALRRRAPRRLQYDGVRDPGMWSAHWLALRKPVMLETPYRMQVRIADKGRSGKMVLLTSEFTVRDGNGTELAVGRHQLKWFAKE